MKRWHFQSTVQCHWCQHPSEDKHHIITCLAPEALLVWKKALNNLHQWLWEQMTLLELVADLIAGLSQWHGTTTSQCQVVLSPWQEEQQEVGWSLVFDGWLSLQWQYEQDQFWFQIWSQKSSQRWTSELIKKLWNIVWDMWEHQNKALHMSPENQQTIIAHFVNDKI